MTHIMRIDRVELDARNGRSGSCRPVHLQTPVLSRFPLFRTNTIVFIPHVIRGRTRIPYTKFSTFILSRGPRQPTDPW